MKKAATSLRSISTEGGYLWAYSEDLTQRRGEAKATFTQIWVQPPGTPTIGMAFLDAWRVTDDPLYLKLAFDAGEALVRGQLESGGWDYRIDFARLPPRRNVTTFDDNTTQSAIRYLMKLATLGVEEPRKESVRRAVKTALEKMMEAQYPNGAWPQRYDGKERDPDAYPVIKASLPQNYPRHYTKEDYHKHYTINDDAQRDGIMALLEASHRFEDERFREAALRGADFLILAQLPEPQPAWAQQYNQRMEPAWARAFEPPAVTAGESVGVMRLLLDVYKLTGEKRFLAPIPRAIDFLERSAIAPNKWARFYELNTNRPIYGDRDGKIHYTLEELSEERRNGYSWQGSYGIPKLRKAYESASKADVPVDWKHVKKPSIKDRKALESRVREIIEALDDQGRWLTEKDDGSRWIDTRVFSRNMATLTDYLDDKGHDPWWTLSGSDF